MLRSIPPVSPAVARHFLLMHLSVTDSLKTPSSFPPSPTPTQPLAVDLIVIIFPLLIRPFYLFFLLVFFTKNLHHLCPRGLHLLSGPRCSPSLHALSPLISPLPLRLSFLPTALSFISCTFPQTRSHEPLRSTGFPRLYPLAIYSYPNLFFFLCASLFFFFIPAGKASVLSSPSQRMCKHNSHLPGSHVNMPCVLQLPCNHCKLAQCSVKSEMHLLSHLEMGKLSGLICMTCSLLSEGLRF